jgi:cell division protein FtsQ
MKSVAGRIKADPRITRRRAAVERAKWRRYRWRAITVAGVGLLVWLALWSPLFKFDGVEVRGGRNVSMRSIVAVADLDSGDNLLTLDQGRIVNAVESLPWVRSARVQRRLPGTISVLIKERSPAMVLTTPDGKWAIDRAGRVIGQGHVTRRLPVIATGTTGHVEPGDEIAAPQVRAAVKAVGSMPVTLRRRIKAVFAASPERITFALHRGPDVRYGAAQRLHDKNAVLIAVLDRLRTVGESPAYVDVRVPESPAVGGWDPSAAVTEVEP